MVDRVKYPVDKANFKAIRQENYLYVDKTSYVHEISSIGTYYFLARPRRFGKSMFLDTLSEYFKGNKELFQGLEIERLQPGDWESYPVVKFNLTGGSFLEKGDLTSLIAHELERNEKLHQIERSKKNINERFNDLIVSLNEKYGKKAVILIDEYDAPLSSAIGKPDLQEIYREQLHGFYSVLKKAEEHIRFCMLTGVTRYGKVSVFSGLNNLNDITFDNKYAGICGITKEELRKYYSEGVEELAKKEGITIEDTYDLLRFHYDGYHFSDLMLDIYNPFSINYAFANLSIEDYWCQSGTPTVLAKTLIKNDQSIKALIGSKVETAELKNLSMHNLEPVALFYQTGYLTLKSYEAKRKVFTLGYPNREVETGILRNVLKVYTEAPRNVGLTVYDMEDAFEEGNPEQAVKILKSFLSDIPLDLREDVKRYENYYHTIFYCIIKLMGLDIDAEYATSEGYIDILVKTKDYIYVIELKVNGTAEDALKQIEEKHYSEPFASDSRKLFKIALGFSKSTGTISSSIIS